MAEVIKNLSQLPRPDIEAIVDYILTLPPKPAANPANPPREATADQAELRVKIIAHEWWWELRYDDPEPRRTLITANELHVPINTAINITLISSNPATIPCAIDLVGHRVVVGSGSTTVRLLADHPGISRSRSAGECHHHTMDLLFIAEEQEEFARWREHQLGSAEQPAHHSAQWGLEIFLSSPCIMCHSIRGTRAGSRVGPDLTHFASPHFIGAGAVPRTRDTISGWIRHPDQMKPSVQMPGFNLNEPELEALTSYLESLRLASGNTGRRSDNPNGPVQLRQKRSSVQHSARKVARVLDSPL